MAEYAQEYANGVDCKDVESILKGGEAAGFTKWSKEEEFQKILTRKLEDHKLNAQDFFNPDKKDMKYFSNISAKLQEFSIDKGLSLGNKLYVFGDKLSNLETQNATRSWRLGLIYAMDDNIKKESPRIISQQI